MESMRNGEEKDSHWIPFTFFDQSSLTIPILKCLGLERSSSSSSSHSEEDDGIITKEEEEDAMTTVEITTRRLQKRPKLPPSTGNGGKHH
ncbi:PREDICTED: elicitor peptide 3-like [Camelina sativa]|uniref:Elicitor peptide 3-like n=1 Tax=Camelina sativa TaxID=90675 RepID=A0ABM0VXJ9_CAMSA|nr:PREDICTED: elicitor peptide 3-like [Camelina sativa]